MAKTIRGRRASYDNISRGEATGFERTFTDTVSRNERLGGGFYTSTSTGDTLAGHSNIAAGASVSESNEPENVKVAGSADGDERVDASS